MFFFWLTKTQTLHKSCFCCSASVTVGFVLGQENKLGHARLGCKPSNLRKEKDTKDQSESKMEVHNTQIPGRDKTGQILILSSFVICCCRMFFSFIFWLMKYHLSVWVAEGFLKQIWWGTFLFSLRHFDLNANECSDGLHTVPIESLHTLHPSFFSHFVMLHC